MGLEPFLVHVEDERLALLGERLRSTVWSTDLPGESGWGYGVPRDELQALVEHWWERYDWRQQEAAMNRFPQVRGLVAGATVHAVHERASFEAALPLVLTHGWPWTFWDFAEIIDPLAHPERYGGDVEDAFHVVVPSLPGSVFSSPAPAGTGWAETAGLWVELMHELGYERFGAHGGDSGAFVTAQLAHAHADRLVGAHLTYPALLGADVAGLQREDFAEDEVDLFDRHGDPTPNMTHFLTHVVEPQTLAWALQDSPVGLASWMLQRRRAWSDCDGDVLRRFTPDQLITSFALHWLPGSVSGALRFYADSFRRPWQPSHDRQPTLQAPTGIAVFPGELTHVPRAFAARHADLVHWTRFDSGGHFAALEEPQALVEDLRTFFRPLRNPTPGGLHDRA